MKAGKRPNREDPDRRARLVATPYVHNVSHRLKKVAKKCSVERVLTASKKLGPVYPPVDGTARQPSYVTNHETQFVPCEVSVVYKIPLTCGKSYFGQ